MCKSSQSRRMDSCIRELIEHMNWYLKSGIKTVASCCGHGRYPMTILIKNEDGFTLEMCHGKWLGRKSRFYKMDSKGFYFIPEVCGEKG